MSLRKFFLKNTFTYKIYLIYNLFIRHKSFFSRSSYSQWGEDIEIINYFKNKQRGKYLDIGCFHPLMYSNTCLLYRKGWSGVNIDLNQTTIDLFNIARPNDLNICRIIGSEEKKVKVYFDSLFSPVNTADEIFYTEHKKTFFKNKFIREVISEKFHNIVEKNHIEEIDFINIDVEGMDYQVLRQIDLNKIKVSLLAIETHYVSGKETKDCLSIVKLLKTNGFILFKRCGPTTLFYRN
jgi:FkbM family methyltransferase